MGEFVAATAFQTDQLDRVLVAVSRFCSANDCVVVQPDRDDVDYANDVLIFAPIQGWTVVTWPTYFADAPAAAAISAELDLLTSTISIHDGDYWRLDALARLHNDSAGCAEPREQLHMVDPSDVRRHRSSNLNRGDLI